MVKRYIAVALTALAALTAAADETADKYEKWGATQKSNHAGIIVRAGYTFGGTSPLPIPAEIRSINTFRPKGGGMIGVEVYKEFSRHWGLAGGLHLVHEGFHTAANVKNYRMSLTMDGNTMSGYFTGCDVTNTEMIGLTIPILATYRISPRWNVSFGPYVSTYFKTTFYGEVYDNPDGIGYLRVDTPTGEKVNIDRTNPATYDFGEEMRPWGAGVELQFDWKAMRHLNVFAQLDAGLAGALNPNFEAVAFTMHPIYATFGLAYRY